MIGQWAVAAVVVLGVTGAVRAEVTRVIDLGGKVHEVGERAVAVVFLGVECPISNRYVPVLNEMARGEKGLEIIGVVGEAGVTRKAVGEWVKAYGVEFPVVMDSSGELVRRLGPGRVPEAFVLGADGAVKYRGRIDDGWAELGRPRGVVGSHDLRDAMAAVAEGREVKEARTAAVGCTFEKREVGEGAGEVTFARDIAPLLYANCVECHRPGQAAPFSLISYADVAKRASLIADVVEDRYMPPWKPERGFGHFVGERGLSESQIAMVRRWEKAGAPEGDVGEMPKVPEFPSTWALGEPDLVVKMGEAYELAAGGKDVYRAFVVPLNLGEDKTVVAAEFRPGNPRVVHHCLLYLDGSGKARELDAAEAGAGYTSFGGPGFTPSGGLGGWAPGATPQRLPEGMGRYVAKGSDVVFQMHYHPSGKVESDQSELALYFAKGPVKKVVGSVGIGRRSIDIAPGDSHYVLRQAVTLPEDVTVIGVVPHMHLIGREMKVRAVGEDGKVTPLIWIKDWDFQWQGQYQYVEPVRLAKGTRVEMEAVYDNSEGNPANPSRPPRRVTFGEQTTDEMCYCFLQVAVDGREELRRINRGIVGQQLSGGLINRLRRAGEKR